MRVRASVQYPKCTYAVKRCVGVWCEEIVCSIKNVTSGIPGEKECSSRRVASAVQQEGCAV